VLTLALAACSKNDSPAPAILPDPGTKAECSTTAIPNQFVINWKDGTTTVERATDRETLRRELLEPNADDIDFAEQDYVVKLDRPAIAMATPPPVETQDWGQRKIGAPEAWAQGAEGEGVIVAVIDSGVDITHPQLSSRLAINAGETGTDEAGHDKATNGIDDDGNGLIDDVFGYDFDQMVPDVTDGAGHGTHVAGIILADHTKGSVKGVAPKAQLLPLDFMDDDGEGNLSDAIQAMDYAASRGAKIINASWGGAPCSESLSKAIQRLAAQGVLFVSASGNSGRNLDQFPEYPAAYGLSNQLTVGASVQRDITADFSNYSFSLVNLLAPGDLIYSTYPTDSAKYLSGTSMATPFVAGAAAVLWGLRPNATLAQIRTAIINSVDKGNYATASRGRLNLAKAITEILQLN